MLSFQVHLRNSCQWNTRIPELVGSFAHLGKLIVGEAMGPSLWIVLVVVRVPYCRARDVVGKVLVRAQLVVQRGMLARGLDAIREDGP